MRYALALHSRLYILDSVYSRTLKHSRLEHNREYRVESADSRVQRVRECKVQRVESVERESTESARMQSREYTECRESLCSPHCTLMCSSLGNASDSATEQRASCATRGHRTRGVLGASGWTIRLTEHAVDNGRQRGTTEHLGEGQTSVPGERRELTNLWCLLERRLISAHPAHPKHRPSHAPVDQRAANLTHWKFAGFVAAGHASQFPTRLTIVLTRLSVLIS